MKSPKKRVVMKDIAESLGISVNSVSLALNGKNGVGEATRNKIIKKAKDLGYELTFIGPPNQQNIVLLLNKQYMNNFAFYSQIIHSIINCARENNYNTIVDFFDPRNPQLPVSLTGQSVSGILIAGTHSDEYAGLLNRSGLPVVTIDHMSYSVETDSILTQNSTGGYIATQYLIDKGHREIGFIGDIQYSISLRQRYIGFQDCISKNALLGMVNHGEYNIIDSIAQSIMDKEYDCLINKIERMPRLPTAWSCCNDETALMLYEALSHKGLQVGKDISVIGFDDIETCTVAKPHLTTMHVHKTKMGAEAFYRLLWRIQHPDAPFRHTCLPVYLVERDSVAIISH